MRARRRSGGRFEVAVAFFGTGVELREKQLQGVRMHRLKLDESIGHDQYPGDR